VVQTKLKRKKILKSEFLELEMESNKKRGRSPLVANFIKRPEMRKIL
jgi:hypothetical protein